MRDTSRNPFIRSYSLVIISVTGLLLVASFAFASIFSGSSVTGKSVNVSITQLTISKPGDATTGDLLLASIAIRGGEDENIQAPAGWNLIQRTDNDDSIGAVTFWKTVSESEPASYTWIITPQTRAVGGITRYSGLDASDPIDALGSDIGKSKVASAPSISTTGSDEQIIAIFATNDGKNSDVFSVTSGMTEEFDTSYGPTGPSIALDDAIQATAGSSGVKSSTLSFGSKKDWVAQQIALRPASTIGGGLVSYWKFDESGGSADDDVTASGNSLTNNNGITYQAGKINNAAQIVRASNQSFTIEDSAQTGLDLMGDFTTSFWVKLDSLPSSSSDVHEYTVISKWSGSGTNLSYRVMIGEDSFGTNSITVLWSDDGSAGPNQAHLGEYYGPSNYFTNDDVGQWAYIVAVADVTNQVVVVYKNGVPTTLTKQSGSSATSIFSGTSAFSVGSLFEINGVPQRILDGEIDEMGIWARKLSPAEVSVLYNGGNGLSYPF